MKLDAEPAQGCLDRMKEASRSGRRALLAVVVPTLVGCTGVSIGVGLPIGGIGGVGVSVDSSGRVSGSVGVGHGGVSVGVGGSAQIPPPSEPAASAPTQ